MATKTAPSPTGSSPGATLSAVLAEDRRREAQRSHQRGHGQGRLLPLLVPACGRPAGTTAGRPPHSQLMLRLHRWGASFLPKSGAAVARELEARRRAPSRPPPGPKRASPVARAATVSVPERRPLREREEPAVREAAAGSKANAEADAAAVADAAIGDRAAPITPIGGGGGGGGGTYLKVSPKKSVRSLSLHTNSSEEGKSPQSLTESPALSVTTDEDKFVWADKYQPNVLNDFICNKGVAAELHQLVAAHQCRHFIFEGPPAVGKRSMVLALIRDAFGPFDLKIEEQTKRFELKGEIRKHIDVRVKISGHHVEVNLADLHGYEKYVITTLLNESIPSPNSICDHTNCKVVVIHDADKLSPDLQHYIGWFLGRYAGCNKIVFCCSDASNLEAVKHLCKVVTLQPPSSDEIIKVLEYIATQESIDLPHDLARRITMVASNNLRQAIRSFEATWKANYPFIEGQPILTGWEDEISNVARNIIEEPSPKQLFVIRGKIRKLIEHDVSPHFIFSHLLAELKRDKDEELQHKIDELALDLNHEPQFKECKSRERNMNIEGFTKAAHEHKETRQCAHDHRETIQCFINIEEFTVKFMSFYRSLIAKNSNKGGAV